MEQSKLFVLPGHGGGDVMVRDADVSMAWDVNDANLGKYCNILMRNGGQARVVGTARDLHKKLANPLKVAGDDNGLESRTTNSA